MTTYQNMSPEPKDDSSPFALYFFIAVIVLGTVSIIVYTLFN